jgi:hypothetical protein
MEWIMKHLLLLALFALGMALPDAAQAIPAWGRKYDMDCAMCHVGGFKLTPAGREFLRNGHQFLEKKDGEATKEKDANLSDYASLAMKFRGYVKRVTKSVPNSAKDAGYNKDSSSFEQHNFTIYTGGPLDNGFSYFAEMYFSENSGKLAGTSDFDDYGRSKLAECFLQYTLGNDNVNTNVRAGQLVSSLLHLNGVGARLPQDRAAVLQMTVGANPYTPFTRQFGVAVAQKVYGLTAEVGLVNGTGSKTYNRIDNDNNKDYWYTLDWTYDGEKVNVQLGGYGYNGSYPMVLDSGAYSGDENFAQWAALGQVTHEDLGHFMGSVFVGDSHALNMSTASANNVRSLGAYAELAGYLMDAKLVPYARFNFTDTDQNKELNEAIGYQIGVMMLPYQHGQVTLHAGQTEKPAKLQSNYQIDSNVTTEFVFIF